MNYWVGWGQRGGSGVTKWHGNDYVSDVTPKYVPEEDLSTLTIHVTDRDGNPVDGARVMVGSYWTTASFSGYQVDIPFPCIWNYTDERGICQIQVATQEGFADANKNFSFRIISKLGSEEVVKIELEHAQDYEFWFELDGLVQESEINDYYMGTPVSNERFKLEVFYELEGANQYPPNPWVGNYHPQPIPISSTSSLTGFIINESTYNYYSGCEYRTGSPIETFYSTSDTQVGNFSFELIDNNNMYFILYNRNSIETSIIVKIKAMLYEKPDDPPEVSIQVPEADAIFEVGSNIIINGTANDDRGIKTLRLRMGSSESGPFDIDITNTLNDGVWEYIWNTTKLINGTYIIKVIAYDTNDNYRIDHIYVDLTPPPPPPPLDETPPVLKIIDPNNSSIFTVGESIEFKGTVNDESEITTLKLYIDSRSIDLLSQLQNDGDQGVWSYAWDSSDKRGGEYKFNVRCIDAFGNQIRVDGHFELIEPYVDLEPPEISIVKPLKDEMFGIGETITILGSVRDNIGVESLLINVNEQQWLDITDSITGTSWMYIWATEDLPVGWHTFKVYAADANGNTEEYEHSILLIDNIPPEVSISHPGPGVSVSKGSILDIEGSYSDNAGIDTVILHITGSGVNEKIRPGRGLSVGDGTWSYSWEVPTYYINGDYTITVTATDNAGNLDTDSIDVGVTSAKEDKKEKDKGFLGLPGFDIGIFLFAILTVLVIIGRSFRRKH
jgi:hypothetical protein